MGMREYLSKLLGKQSEAPEHFVNHGSTGIEVFAGNFSEEYLAKFLNMPSGMDIYDKMRRSDYQVAMLLSAVKNPIVSANWGIEAVDDSEEEQEIAEFVRFCLFEDIRYPDGSKVKSFRDFLTEALTCLDFGFSLFEPVYKVVMDHPVWGNYIGLRDIAFRSQKTIYEWHLNNNGTIKSVRQLAQGDLSVDVQIPGEQLMVITNKKEGDNYEGISMLRPIYGNYLRKDFYNKMMAMGLERCATGILVGKVPQSAADDADQLEKIKKMLKRYTSNESAYMLFPTGFELEVTKIDFDADKVDEAISNEDRRMAKSILAGFLELGMGKQGGSQALSKDLSTIFLNGIEIYSENIGDAVENKIIRKLVDAKYGKRAKYPQCKAQDVNNKNGKERAEVAVMLKNAGLIRDSDQLEDSLNRDFDFPVISQEQKARDKKEGKGRSGAAPVVKENFTAEKELSETIKFAENNPTLFIKDRAKNIHTLMETELTGRVAIYLSKIEKQLKKEPSVQKRRKIVQNSELPGKSDYKKKVRLEMAQIAKEATRNVLKELNNPKVKFDEFNEILKAVPFALRDKLRANIEELVNDQDAELKKRMFFIASQKLDTTDSVDAVIADMKKAAESYTITSGVLGAAATNVTSDIVNSARNGVFQTPEVFEEIESFIIVNPSPEAPICKELTGRVFSKEEYLNQDLPPYHHRCETTVKAQLKGQKNNLPVNPIGLRPTGTPEQIEKILKSKTF